MTCGAYQIYQKGQCPQSKIKYCSSLVSSIIQNVTLINILKPWSLAWVCKFVQIWVNEKWVRICQDILKPPGLYMPAIRRFHRFNFRTIKKQFGESFKQRAILLWPVHNVGVRLETEKKNSKDIYKAYIDKGSIHIKFEKWTRWRLEVACCVSWCYLSLDLWELAE